MASVPEALVAISWLVNLVLGIGAAYYCYRMTRITGGFRAWWLMIAFTILFVVANFFSVAYSVIQPGTSGGTLGAAQAGVAYLDIALWVLMSVLLFMAMYGLQRTFRRVQKAAE